LYERRYPPKKRVDRPRYRDERPQPGPRPGYGPIPGPGPAPGPHGPGPHGPGPIH
jgi:hypothetical protein